jgi:porphobilinogen synthase
LEKLTFMSLSLPIRPRRNRKSESIRKLVQEHFLNVSDLVMPLFVMDGENQKTEIASMPGIYRYSLDLLVEECKVLFQLGIPAVALFPCIHASLKNKSGTESWNESGLYAKTIRAIKSAIPKLTLITDVAMDPYSSEGHDGFVNDRGEIDNDATLPILAKMALCQAKSGADIVAPSDMMDGRVRFIREILDQGGFQEVGILSYSVKYASGFYGPFRDALNSSPKSGDKKTYQMNPANVKEALHEVALDIQEGADIVMVKPGLPYLDVLRAVAEISPVPVAVYNVSGEYAMVKAAGLRGWLDVQQTVLEILLSFKRAGASFIITYHAKEAAEWLNAKA